MKNNFSLKFYSAFCLFLLNCISAMASAYWIDVKGSGKINEPLNIELCYGSMDEYGIRRRDSGNELQLTGDFQIRIVDPKGNEQLLQLTMQKDCWLGTYLPKIEGQYRILGINDKHPVVDRSATGGENVLPIDYITAVYNVGNAIETSENPLQMLDIIIVFEDKKAIVKAFSQEKLSKAGTKIRVFNPENWEKEIILDKNGEAVFYPTMKGLYIIRQDWKEPISGTYKEVKFTSKRHRCNYYLLY